MDADKKGIRQAFFDYMEYANFCDQMYWVDLLTKKKKKKSHFILEVSIDLIGRL